MAYSLSNGADVELKAVFKKTLVDGKSVYTKVPIVIETRTYPTVAKGGRQTYFAFAYGRPPGRANSFDTERGEHYEAVEYYDVYPDTWPRIGIPQG